MKKHDDRVSSSHIYKDGQQNVWLTGEAVWSELNEQILSEEGKKLVAADPDLSEVTLRRLALLQNFNMKEIKPPFGQIQDIEENGSEKLDPDIVEHEVSFALLSSCIKDDLAATWAEFVARYAAIRRTPFLETAMALKALYIFQGNKFFYYMNNGKQMIPWSPNKAKVKRGTMDREMDLQSEWGLLASKNRFSMGL